MRAVRPKLAGFAVLVLLCVDCIAQAASGSPQASPVAEIQSLIRAKQYDQALASLRPVSKRRRAITICGHSRGSHFP